MTDLELKAVENEQLRQIEKSSFAIYTMENPSDTVKYRALKKDSSCITRINPTPEMVAYAVRQGQHIAFKCDTSAVTNQDVIEGIKNSRIDIWTNTFCKEIPEKFIDKEVASVAVTRYSMCLAYPNIKKYKDNDLIDLAFKAFEKEEKWYKKNNSRHKGSMLMLLEHNELTDDRMMRILKIQGEDVLWRIKKIQHKLSKKVKDYIIKTYEESLKELDLDGEDLLIWYEAHSTDDIKKSYLYERLLSPYKDKSALLEKYGNLIVDVKKPKAGEKMAAIKCDPMNLKYIYQQTEKLCMAALELNKDAYKYVDKKTKKILKFMGIEVEKPDPVSTTITGSEFKSDAKYLVTIEINIADEGYVHYSDIINGKDMDKFLDKYVSVAFGNLDEDTNQIARLLTNYKELSDIEEKILRKSGLVGMNSGIWTFSDN